MAVEDYGTPMNTENPTTPEESTPETQVVEGLIRIAGRRAAPPEASYRRTLELATDAWRAKTARSLPHVVDSVLLLSALTLAWLLRLTPGNASWLLAKIVGLVLLALLCVSLPLTAGSVAVGKPEDVGFATDRLAPL